MQCTSGSTRSLSPCSLLGANLNVPQRTTLLLQLEADYSNAPHVLKSDQQALDQAAEDICQRLGKFKKGALKVVRREVPTQHRIQYVAFPSCVV